MNYAPNVKYGKEKMIALLFDMNILWEEYVFNRLKSHADEEVKVKSQVSRTFWKGVSIRPDIVIETRNNERYIVDTKWKNLIAGKPSTHDLRQMYVYNEYWGAIKSLLLYPSVNSSQPQFSNFENKCDGDVIHQCGIGFVSIFNQDSSRLNREIGKEILGFFS
jgi:5-methylcytosine-specific restriction enzyme subunit McrC